MSAIQTSEQDKTDGPISEKTRAILAAINRLEKKVDMIITDKNGFRAALMRAIKQFISQVEK